MDSARSLYGQDGVCVHTILDVLQNVCFLVASIYVLTDKMTSYV